MKQHHRHKETMLFVFLFILSCKGQDTIPVTKDYENTSISIPSKRIKIYGPAPDPFLEGQISQYIRRMFQDKNGDLWFGTNGDGVCRYDGHSLTYFTPTEGFGGEAVRGILEEEHGNLWFATDRGVCRFDGSRANHPCLKNTCTHDFQKTQDLEDHDREIAQSFTNYTTKDGLCGNQVWSILIDKAGTLWFGTEGGVSRYDGKTFSDFPLPAANLQHFPDAYPAPKLVNCIFQDKAGIIWFGTNGNGVYRYDGTSLTNISEKEGLCNNFVQCILQDKTGQLWFGTRFGGLSRYDGKTFTRFGAKEGLSHNFAWTMLEDKTAPADSNAFWLGTAGGGLYRYGGKTFTNFTEKDGLTNKYVQSLLIDKNGKLWVGASGGLFRLDGKSFVNVRKIGPWD